MKQMVLVANQTKEFRRTNLNFNWVPFGHILGIASTGAFVDLQGERKCTTHASVVELDVDYEGLIRESTKASTCGMLTDAEIEECVQEEMKMIQEVIAEMSQ